MWYHIEKQAIRINILVKPNAKKTAILGISEQCLSISLHAQPKDGEANLELIRFLAKLFSIPKTQIQMIRGEKSKIKHVVLPLNDTILQFLYLFTTLPKTAINSHILDKVGRKTERAAQCTRST